MKDNFFNFLSEVLGIFVFVFIIFVIGKYNMFLGVGMMSVGMLVVGIGLLFGGIIGYVINFVCDFGFCLLYVLLLMKNKGDFDWIYLWILIVGFMVGVILVVLLFVMM